MAASQRQQTTAMSSETTNDQGSKGLLNSKVTAPQSYSLASDALGSAAEAPQDAELDSFEAALPILPKGIVENTEEIYTEVASFDVIPTEKLREYWRVYTITHRKLYDPTANRLENFWWHIWGSKRRDLSGKTVARLYKQISTAPTFVPLKTPSTRYDGPTINFLQQPSVSKQSTDDTRRPSSSHARNNTTDRELSSVPMPISSAPNDKDTDTTLSTDKAETRQNDDTLNANKGPMDNDSSNQQESRQEAHIKLLSSSSSRPTPAQSILRKLRPSLSGPRPTPRFDLPCGERSEAEDNTVEQSGVSTTGNGNDDCMGIDTSGSDSSKSKPAKMSAPDTKTRAPAARRDVVKPGKTKAVKKKFVVNSAASKRRTVVSKRTGSQGSQSSGASEGPGPRETPNLLPRHSGESLIDVMEEAEDDAPPALLGSPISLDPTTSKVRTLKQQQQQEIPQAPPVTNKAAGKRPARPLSSIQQERETLPASKTALVPSKSGSVVGSTTKTATRAARSMSAQYTTDVSRIPESLASSGGSNGLEMPVTMRKRQADQQPNSAIAPAALSRPGGRLIRQSTVPYETGQGYREQLSRTSSSIIMSPSRRTGKAPSTSAYPGPSSGAAPGLSAATISAPQMGRSMSQDSYGLRPRLGYQSPILGPMRSTTIAAPSMVAASGVFLDGEGPDPFELYAKTGLSDTLDDDLDGGHDLPPYVPENGSFSATFQSPSSFQTNFPTSSSFPTASSLTDSQPAPPRPLFTPTRPAQTPRIPFARTRSQLNVILGREKERLGEGSYASWQESRGARDQHDHQGEREPSGSQGS